MAEIIPISAAGKLSTTGLDLTGGQVAATTPSLFANDGQTLLVITLGATAGTITIQQNPCSHGRTGTQAIVLNTNKTTILGPFPQQEYNDGNGKLNFTMSSVVAVTIAALKHP
jgi:hypothetical protein